MSSCSTVDCTRDGLRDGCGLAQHAVRKLQGDPREAMGSNPRRGGVDLELGAALGIEARAKRVPSYVLRGVGLFMPVLRELVEMAYQWEMPFEVDDGAFVARFGWGATPNASIVEATAAWARERFGVKAPAIAAPRPL